MQTANDKPLSGVRVLELARILAGPWAGQLLGDLGADVTKIEHPQGGDDTRGWGPPFVANKDGTQTSAYYHCCNRGKRVERLDFQDPQSRARLITLVKDSDILIENFKTGSLQKYGLDYESLKAVNPGLIYCSITGFGQDGPYANRAGYDFMIQAMSGIMDVTGERDGPPLKTGVAIADLFTGHYAVAGILAALYARTKTGKGAWLDLSLLDCMVASLANQAANYLTSGVSPQRRGNAHPNIVPYDAFPCADGHIIIAVGSDRQFFSLCDVLGANALKADPVYATNAGRVAARDILVAALAAKTIGFEKAALLAALEQNTVPAGPINTIEEMFADPQVIARRLVVDTPSEQATSGIVKAVRCPIRFI